MVTKEQFDKVWEDSSKECILNQYYSDYVEYWKLVKTLKDLKDKLITYGEIFDSDINKQFQRECLGIIDNILEEN